jgi:DNA polymerase-3 subunit alpha
MGAGRAFVHLHAHSAYSLLDGLCRIPDLVEEVHRLGMSAVALTDHDTISGAYEFHDAARRAGIQPVLGCELSIRIDPWPAFPVVLLAENADGFDSLRTLVSLARLRDDEAPFVVLDELAEHRRGLISLSGSWPRSLPAALCAERRFDEAETLVRDWAGALERGSAFLEIQRQGLPAQDLACAGLRELSRRTGLPRVVTHNVHYLHPSDAEDHLLLQCIQSGLTWRERDRVRFPTRNLALLGPREMAELFPDDGDALERTVEIADRCSFVLPEAPRIHFPEPPIPEDFRPAGDSGFRRDLAYLRDLARTGLARRRSIAPDDLSPVAGARLDAELRAVEQAGYARTLRVLADLAEAARELGIPVGPGRGTEPSSFLAYALGITGVDPSACGLFAERWLNPSLPDPPELSLDVATEGRVELLKYLGRRYGTDRVGHLLAFGTLGPRSALREAARVHELDSESTEALLHRLPETAGSLAEVAPPSGGTSLPGEDREAVARVWNAALRIEGLPRIAGTHPSGVVLSDLSLMRLAPVARDRNGFLHVQLDLRNLRRAGLLKIDVSGHRVLEGMGLAARWASERLGRAIDPEFLPTDDPRGFELISSGRTLGVAYAESPGMKEWLQSVAPVRIGDLAAALALHRPNPPVPPAEYLRKRADPGGKKAADPLLDFLLEETEGCLLYEEQILAAAVTLFHRTGEEADRFFRLAAVPGSSAVNRYRPVFLESIRKAKRIRSERANRLFDLLVSAAPRGVGKAAVWATALLMYRSACLKTLAPIEFLAARLAAEPGILRRVAEYLAEARALGLRILPPDINRSGVRFSLAPGGLRFGLAAIRHVGEDAAHALVQERERGGLYADLFDLCRRHGPQIVPHRVLDALVRCGALDAFGLSRARLAAALRIVLSEAATERKERRAGQSLLFQPAELESGAVEALGATPEWDTDRMRQDELDLLGALPDPPSA